MKHKKSSLSPRKSASKKICGNLRSLYPQKFAPKKIRGNPDVNLRKSASSSYLRQSAVQKICGNPRVGLIQVYTGDGKGKTTAAVGQVIRALGQGLKVCFIQFFKNPNTFSYGEQRIFHSLPCTKMVRGLPRINFYNFVPQHPYFFKKIKKVEIEKQLQEGLNFIRKILRENDYDLLVLDELIIALRDKYLKTEELIKLLKQKPKNMEIILTGRGAPKKLIKFADLVTEMKKVKHPYDKGGKARKGIEY